MGAAGFRIAALALLGAGCTSIAADARTFERTQWRVSAINGHATPPSGNFAVSFKDGRIGGQLGCNHFGGAYRVAGDVMTTTAIAMTQMACGAVGDAPTISLMDYESWGLAVLARPMRLSWYSSQKLTLSNAAGSIDLTLPR
jgi:heat shock protein HslJ